MRTLRFWVLVLLLHFGLALAQATPLKGWNSQDLANCYFHNSDLQLQWAWHCLSHYRFRGYEQILDFGSGDGKLSALISRMVPAGTVQGVDISQQMVAYASKKYPNDAHPNLRFTQVASLADLPASSRFDTIVSFNVLHLVPNPREVLAQFRDRLHPDGKVVLIVSLIANPELLRAMHEEFAINGLSLPVVTEDTRQIRLPEGMLQMLREASYDVEHFEVVATRTSFVSREELVDWFIGTAAANWNVPFENSRALFSSLVDRYLAYRPQDAEDEDGFVHLFWERMDIVAKPSVGS